MLAGEESHGRAAEEPQQDALRRAVESGAALTGSTVGAGAGLAVAGPLGAVGGAAAGWAVEELVKAGGEIVMRVLSPQAEARVGAVFQLACDEISARLVAGDQPREDLLKEISPGRTPAVELGEATLIAAAQTHEERKLPYLAHLLAAIAFEPDLGHADANQLVATADDLSYRQLVLLAVFATLEDMGKARWGLHGEAVRGLEEANTLTSIRADILALFQRGLLYVRPTSRARPIGGDLSLPSEPLPWPAVPAEMSPKDTFASPSGERLARMMRLDLVPAEDREELVMAHIRIPNRS